MSLLRYAARRDDIEPLIVSALRAAGWGVLRLSAGGVPDLRSEGGQVRTDLE